MYTLSWALLALLFGGSAAERKQTFIIQRVPGPTSSLADSLLASVEALPADIVYHYHSLNAFAVSITPSQAGALRSHGDVLAVHASRRIPLHTTRTPKFLGLDDAALLGSPSGAQGNGTEGQLDASNMIIGLFDSGAWPESASYHDAGMPEVPAHWKGACVTGDGWSAANCNKKLIGARYFSKGLEEELKQNNIKFTDKRSARDTNGHGTHTSSTAAGSPVQNASSFGLASGTARGMAVKARIAIYKVCWTETCSEADVLAGMDAAIQDGVNVMSLSLGDNPGPVAQPVNKMALKAIKSGIFVSMSAGNEGPDAGTVSNLAPWMLTSGAGTLDRDFPAVIQLGNGVKVTGVTGYTDGSVPGVKPLPKMPLPFISGTQAAFNASSAFNATRCLDGNLDPKKVAGKIVLCMRGGQGPLAGRLAKAAAVRKAGGLGFVLANAEKDGELTEVDPYLVPAVHLGYKDGTVAFKYVNTTTSATATIVFEGTRVGIEAPKLAYFSSRGPTWATLTNLKPDIIAPGVTIVAAWNRSPPTLDQIVINDTRKVDFAMITGTSMACPHMSGLAALVKAHHPEWSPAAIRSAFITTAYVNTKGVAKPIVDMATSSAATPFDMGAGHVNFVRSLDPGLIYDAGHDDYVAWACTQQDLNASDISYLANDRSYKCKTRDLAAAFELNEPSFTAVYDTNSTVTKNGTAPWTILYKRTVTNVGAPGTYRSVLAMTDPNKLVKATISPNTLTFTAKGEKQTYTVSVTLAVPPPIKSGTTLSAFGSLTWYDASHRVSSPMAWSFGNVYQLAAALNAKFADLP